MTYYNQDGGVKQSYATTKKFVCSDNNDSCGNANYLYGDDGEYENASNGNNGRSGAVNVNVVLGSNNAQSDSLYQPFSEEHPIMQPQYIQPQMIEPQYVQPQYVQPQIIQPQMLEPRIYDNHYNFEQNIDYPEYPANNYYYGNAEQPQEQPPINMPYPPLYNDIDDYFKVQRVRNDKQKQPCVEYFGREWI